MNTSCQEQLTVAIRRLPNSAQVPLPEYKTEQAAGMDIHAAVDSTVVIETGVIVLVPTGFAIAVPQGYEAQIRPRSGLSVKHGITIPNSPGTIDSDYRGEVKIALINLGPKAFEITPAMRIAQMIVKPVPQVSWQIVDQLPDTQRGEGGFGHTG